MSAVCHMHWFGYGPSLDHCVLKELALINLQSGDRLLKHMRSPYRAAQIQSKRKRVAFDYCYEKIHQIPFDTPWDEHMTHLRNSVSEFLQDVSVVYVKGEYAKSLFEMIFAHHYHGKVHNLEELGCPKISSLPPLVDYMGTWSRELSCRYHINASASICSMKYAERLAAWLINFKHINESMEIEKTDGGDSDSDDAQPLITKREPLLEKCCKISWADMDQLDDSSGYKGGLEIAV